MGCLYDAYHQQSKPLSRGNVVAANRLRLSIPKYEPNAVGIEGQVIRKAKSPLAPEREKVLSFSGQETPCRESESKGAKRERE